MKKNNKIIITVIVAVVLVFLAVRVVFDKQFDEWGDGLEKIGIWQDQYKKDHPNATKAEMDAAFDGWMQGLVKWKADYMRDNPGATDAQADAAFKAAWDKK